jgi:tetratricopeptide (TPR) repeat protein
MANAVHAFICGCTAIVLLVLPQLSPALTFREVELTCPLDGSRFNVTRPASGTSRGIFLDLKPFGPIIAPWPLARCPSNGFVLYKPHFSDEEIARLRPFVASAEYQALQSHHTTYYLAARLRAYLGETPAQLAWTLLEATWEAEPGAQYERYATEALRAFQEALAEPYAAPTQWVADQLVAGELERRLGRFEPARQRFLALTAHDAVQAGGVRAILALQLQLIDAQDARPRLAPEPVGLGDGESDEALRSRGEAFAKQGDRLADRGEPAAALAAYRSALTIAQQLAARDPVDPDWQRALAVGHHNIGHLARDQGDLAAALTAFQAGLRITERLTARDPANTRWQRDRADAWHGVALTFWKQGNTAEAAAAYASGLAGHPHHLVLLSEDAELAFVQGDRDRLHRRVAAALPHVTPKDQLSVLLPFFTWLADPAQGWAPVLTAVHALGPGVEVCWDFSDTRPALMRLDPATQRAAQHFLDFFEGRTDVPTLQARLGAP